MNPRRARDARHRLIWPWPVGLAVVAVVVSIPGAVRTLGQTGLVHAALHAVVTVLAWVWIRGLAVPYGTALLASALFAVVPSHVVAVATREGRSALVATAVALAGLVALTAKGGLGRTVSVVRALAAWAVCSLAWVALSSPFDERSLYLPMLGPCLAVAFAGASIAARGSTAARVVVVVASVAVIALAAVTLA